MSTTNNSTPTTGESDSEGESDSGLGLLDKILEQSTPSGAERPDVHSVLDPSQESTERRVNISTKEALRYLRDAPGVEAGREDRKWTLSVEWEGEEIFAYSTKDFNEAHRVMKQRAAPIAKCLEFLEKASEQVEDYTARSLWPAVSEYAASGPTLKEYSCWVFVDEDTQEILHIIGGNRSLDDAIRHFRANVQEEGPIEIWSTDPHWRKEVAHHVGREPQVGDCLDDIPTLTMGRVLNRELTGDAATENDSPEEASPKETS